MFDSCKPHSQSVFSTSHKHAPDNSHIRRYQLCQLSIPNNKFGHSEIYQCQCRHTKRQNNENEHEVLWKQSFDESEVHDHLTYHNKIPYKAYGHLILQKRSLGRTKLQNHQFDHPSKQTYQFEETKIHNHSSDETAVEENSHDLTKCHHILHANSSYDICNIKCHLQHSIPIFLRIPLFANKPVRSLFRRFQSNVLSCAALLLSIFVLQMTVTASSASVPASSTSTSSKLQLNIGILVAESSNEGFVTELQKKSSEAIVDFKRFVQLTEGDSNQILLEVNYDIYSFNTTKDVVSNLSIIFGNSTINAILGVSNYDMHRSFIPIAEVFEKAYIPVNSFILTLAKAQSTSFAPKFSQRGQMLAKVLDMYKWQNVHIIFSNFNVWQDFATYMYFEMTLLEFKVTLGQAVSSPVTSENAQIPLQDVGNSKGKATCYWHVQLQTETHHIHINSPHVHSTHCME